MDLQHQRDAAENEMLEHHFNGRSPLLVVNCVAAAAGGDDGAKEEEENMAAIIKFTNDVDLTSLVSTATTTTTATAGATSDVRYCVV